MILFTRTAIEYHEKRGVGASPTRNLESKRGRGAHATNFSYVSILIASLSILVGLVRADLPSTAPSTSTASAAADTDELHGWLTSLDDAYKQAVKDQKPILIYAGATWCEPCHKLKQEIAKADVQQKLSGWTCVYIDIDQSPDVAKTFGVTSIPALRALSPLGASAASTEGFMADDELIKWLDSASQAVAVLPLAEELVGTAPPDDAALIKLLKDLCSDRPAVHEAAVHRLMPHAGLAAQMTVEIFAKGELAERLAAMDLLQEWNAPLADADPWRSATITDACLTTLRDWAKHPTTAPSPSTSPSVAPSTKPTASIEGQINQDLADLIAAPTDAAALPIRERLARTDARILRPILLEHLRLARSDSETQRLTALRFRLASTNQLPLAWPGGLERLASTDAAVRHQAMQELSARATADDAPLLIELFASSDPLLREMSLRKLQSTGAANAADVMAGLLNDPEPNVRAAVLKQFAEQPDEKVVTRVIAYLQKESDPNLVVYAVRVLKESTTPAAKASLLSLCAHPAWRVRAEAAEALTDMSQESDTVTIAAMRKLLDDPEGFVVSRAIIALEQWNDSADINAMFAAAKKHPGLLLDLITSFHRYQSMLPAALPQMRQLVTFPDAPVRAIALTALTSSQNAGDISPQVLAGLADPDESVRIAAANGVFVVAETLRPQNGFVTKRGWFSDSQKRVNVNRWFDDWRAGKEQPPWIGKAIPLLSAMLASASISQRRAAAIALIVAGKEDPALQMFSSMLSSAPSPDDRVALQSAAANLLPWVPSQARADLFARTLSSHPEDKEAASLAERLSNPPDPQSLNLLWSLVSPADATPSVAEVVISSLETLAGSAIDENEEPATTLSQIIVATAAQKTGARGRPPATTAAAVTANDTITSSTRPSQPSDMQRLTALAILAKLDSDRAAKLSAAIVADPTASEWSHIDALQVELLCAPAGTGESIAVNALKSSPALGKVALPYLSSGPDAVQTFHGTIYLPEIEISGTIDSEPVTSKEILVKPPKGLTADMVRPYLKDSDPAIKAYAGYLLATFGDRSGFDALLAMRSDRNDQWNDQWKRLIYRAVAALRDDSLISNVKQIYDAYPKRDVRPIRELFWTIHPMLGTNAKALRKEIEQSVGDSNLNDNDPSIHL